MNNKIIKNKNNDDFIVKWIDKKFNTMELKRFAVNQYKIINNLNNYVIYITTQDNAYYLDLFYRDYSQASVRFNSINELKSFLNDVCKVPESITNNINLK